MAKQNKKPELTIDEKVDKCWYSRWIGIREDEYQCVLGLLEESHTSNPEDEIVTKTLNTFTRGQEIHYRTREEYRQMMKEGKIQPQGGRPDGE